MLFAAYPHGTGLHAQVEPKRHLNWEQAPELKHQRYYHTSTLFHGGRLLVAGGRDGSQPLSTCEVYDPTDGPRGSWSEIAPLNFRRERHAAAVFPSGIVLLTGGIAEVPSRTCEYYDVPSNRWVVFPDLNDARYEHSAVILASGRILVIGSKNYDRGFTGCEILDFENVSGDENGSPVHIQSAYWRRTGALNHGRGKHTATVLRNGKVLVTGGVGNYSALRSCELFDPFTETWKEVASMSNPREGHTATLLPDGRVLVTGGGISTVEQNSCEVYDPEANNGLGVWTSLPMMSVSRKNHTATLLSNGLLLVAGAWIVGQGETSCELISVAPTIGSGWILTGATTIPHGNHTATLLGNNRVLLVGGEIGGSQGATASCEISTTGSILGMDNLQEHGGIHLLQNHPNPFRYGTTISFTLEFQTEGSLSVYDLWGRRLRRLLSGRFNEGLQSIYWDGKTGDDQYLPNGTYLYRLETSAGSRNGMMTLFR